MSCLLCLLHELESKVNGIAALVKEELRLVGSLAWVFGNNGATMPLSAMHFHSAAVDKRRRGY